MPNTRRVLIPIVLLALFLGLLGGLGVILSQRDLPPSEADFACFYLGSKALFQGQDAYSLDLLKAMAPLEGFDGWVYPYLYPPHFAFLLLPFIIFPLRVGAVLWSIASALLLVAAVFLLCQGDDSKKPNFKLFIAATLLTAVSAPMVWNIALGQTSAMLVFLGALTLWSLRSERYVLAGVGLALASAKPQIMLLFVVLVLMVMLRRKNWALLLSFATIFLLLGVIVTLIRADLLMSWLQTIVLRQNTGKIVLSSLVFFKSNMGETLGTAVYLLWTVGILAIVAYLALRWGKIGGEVFGLVLGIGTPAMLLISPYYEPYDCAVFLLAILPTTKLAFEQKKPGDILLTVILWLGMVLFPSFLWAIPREEMTGLTSLVMILSPLAVFVTGLLVFVRRTRYYAALPMLTP